MKDEVPIDWREDFHNSHWIRRTSSRKGHGKLWGGEEFLFCVFGRGGECMCERKINLLCVKKCYS